MINHNSLICLSALQMPWYWYLALAFIDVQGNCLGKYIMHDKV